jgi:lipopolysaccharide export system ATP-binding protein
VRETLEITDRAFVLHDGSILAEGKPAELVADARVRRHYLGEDFRM